MEKELPLLQNEIRCLTSENLILQSDISAKEKKMSRNKSLMDQLSAQLRHEEQKMQAADRDVVHEIQNFVADVCATAESGLSHVSHKLTEKMRHVRQLCDRSVQRQDGESSIPVSRC